MLSREAMLRRLHLADEHYRRRARSSFAEFLRHTKPDYQLSWFHEELAAVLDGFLDDVLARHAPRLIVNVPPQGGKSEQVSRRFADSLWEPPQKMSTLIRTRKLSNVELAAELERLGLESVQ